MTLKIKTTDDPRRLSQAILQVIDCLNMYHAELARILRLRCGDIGLLSSGQIVLTPDTPEWRQSLRLVRMYQKLYENFDGDGAEMIHWMRSDKNHFERSPHIMIIDEGRLAEVVEYLYE